MSATVDKYSVTQYSVNGILGSIENGEIAIPKIQRPSACGLILAGDVHHIFPKEYSESKQKA
jgi:hypothetical protein